MKNNVLSVSTSVCLQVNNMEWSLHDACKLVLIYGASLTIHEQTTTSGIMTIV